MSKVEDYKEVEIKGRKFVIRKFDARTGSFMLLKVLGLLAPMFKKLDKAVKVEDSKTADLEVGNAMTVLSALSEDDFNYIQDKCLQVCFEPLAAGPTRVLNDNGSFGVMGLENDTMTVMALTAHALIFNVTGFFGESPLASLMGAALTSSRPGA